jgi:hypothetical protein
MGRVLARRALLLMKELYDVEFPDSHKRWKHAYNIHDVSTVVHKLLYLQQCTVRKKWDIVKYQRH